MDRLLNPEKYQEKATCNRNKFSFQKSSFQNGPTGLKGRRVPSPYAKLTFILKITDVSFEIPVVPAQLVLLSGIYKALALH